MRMPAPSPVLASEPAAPRCSRLTSTVSASRTMAWDRRPATSTTKPKPHEIVLRGRLVERTGLWHGLVSRLRPVVGWGRNGTKSITPGQEPRWYGFGCGSASGACDGSAHGHVARSAGRRVVQAAQDRRCGPAHSTLPRLPAPRPVQGLPGSRSSPGTGPARPAAQRTHPRRIRPPSGRVGHPGRGVARQACRPASRTVTRTTVRPPGERQRRRRGTGHDPRDTPRGPQSYAVATSPSAPGCSRRIATPAAPASVINSPVTRNAVSANASRAGTEPPPAIAPRNASTA